MDIILNTTFNNPNLPVVPIPGFTDSFDRPAAASLGTTDDGKEWSHFGATPWNITSDGHAIGLQAAPVAVVDSLATDGTLTARVGKAPSAGADQRGGIVLRALDDRSYIFVSNHNTGNSLNLYVRDDGTSVISQMVGPPLATGDIISVTLSGEQLSIAVNGDTLYSETFTQYVGETRHGMYSHSACDMEWDWIEFTP